MKKSRARTSCSGRRRATSPTPGGAQARAAIALRSMVRPRAVARRGRARDLVADLVAAGAGRRADRRVDRALGVQRAQRARRPPPGRRRPGRAIRRAPSPPRPARRAPPAGSRRSARAPRRRARRWRRRRRRRRASSAVGAVERQHASCRGPGGRSASGRPSPARRPVLGHGRRIVVGPAAEVQRRVRPVRDAAHHAS